MLSDYLLSILVLISSQAIVDGASSVHVSSLTIPNHHHGIPKTSPLQSPRSFREPFSNRFHADRDLSSMLPISNEKGQSSHQTGPLQYLSDLILPSDDYLKKSFETNKQKTLRQTVRENIREIDGSCLKLLAKRTTGNEGRNCVKMETFVTDLQKYIANMRSNSLTTRNLFFEAQAFFHKQLVDTSGVTDSRAVSLIYHLNEMIANVKSFNVDPRFLDGAEVTKVIGTEGRSITYWNSEGHWKTLLDYRDGKHSFKNEELNNVEIFSQERNNLLRFLKENFPLGPYGKPYGNGHYQKGSDLLLAHTESFNRELKQRNRPIAIYNLQQEYSEILDFLHPTITFRNTYEVDPTMQISIKFFKDGSTAASFRIFPTSSEAASYTSEFNAQSLMNLLEKPPLIRGGERTDKDGIVRDLRVGKYDSSIDEYYLSAIHLLTIEGTEIKYKVRDTKRQSFNRSAYPYTFLNKIFFFKYKYKFPDLPVVSTTNSETPVNEHGNSDSRSGNRANNGQSDSASTNPGQRKSSPKATLRDDLSEFDKIIYDGLVSTHGFKPDYALSSIALKDTFLSELNSFDVDPKLLHGAVLTKVYGANGHSLTYLSSKGKFEKIIKFDNGEFSVTDIARSLQRKNPGKIANLINFLNHFLPGNVNGKPYENLQNDLENLKEELENDSNDWNDNLDLIPSLMLQNAFGEKTIYRVAVQFLENGDIQLSTIVFPRSKESSPTSMPATGKDFEEKDVRDEKAASSSSAERNDQSSQSTNADESGSSSTENVKNVRDTFTTGPAGKVDEERKNDGTLKRFMAAFQDPKTLLYKIKTFAGNSAILGGSVYLYFQMPWIVSKTHINNFDGFFDGLNHQFDNDDIDPSIFDEPRVATNIFDEPNHNAHESIFGRVLGDHGGITGNINALSHLPSDIIHGAQQDTHDFFELCHSVRDYVGDQIGLNCDHHGHFLMQGDDFDMTDLMEAARTHISHLPEFKVSITKSVTNVIAGMLWNKFRSLSATKQAAIGGACLLVLPMLPNAAVTIAAQQVTFRVGANALIGLSDNEKYQTCMSNLIPYFSVLLGDPTHIVSGLTVTFISVEISKKISRQIAKIIEWIFHDLFPKIKSRYITQGEPTRKPRKIASAQASKDD